MRAYEQIRVNLSLHAQLMDLNVNLIGVGAGLSYEVSGPTHHRLEDMIIIMRMTASCCRNCPEVERKKRHQTQKSRHQKGWLPQSFPLPGNS